MSCALDPIPTFLLKELADILLLLLMTMINSLLCEAHLLGSQMLVVVTPLL
jgi:hypothetical protein